MKYGVIPENIVEELALIAGKVPIPILDALFSIIKARAIMAGVSLGIFEAMRKGAYSSAKLARRLSLNAECLDLLLRTLVTAGYLTYEAGRYALSKLGRHTMLAGGEMQMSGFVQWNYKQWEFVEGLEELIRTGNGIDFHSKMRNRKAWRDYQQAMLDIARLDAATVASRVPVPDGAKRMLDLGGSHGLFGATLCRKHPPMKSTVIDLPQAIIHARKLAKAEGIDDVVEHRAGNLLTSDLGTDYAVVLLANVLHHFQPKEIGQIARRTRKALQARGTVVIWEVEASLKEDKVAHTDSAALYFRLTSSARAYHGDDYARWLEKAGFRSVSVKRPKMSPGSVLVIGRAA